MIARTALAMLSLLLVFDTAADIVTREVSYKQGDTVMKGLVAYDDSIETVRPGILVVHEWWGLNDYARKRARMLAELGYTALAVDMYGDGKTAGHPDNAAKFSSAVGGNPELAKARFDAALDTLKQQPGVEVQDLDGSGHGSDLRSIGQVAGIAQSRNDVGLGGHLLVHRPHPDAGAGRQVRLHMLQALGAGDH